MDYDQFIIRLDEQLQSTDCEIWRKPHITESREVALLATRVKRPLIRVPIHLFVDYKDRPAADDFAALFIEGLPYAKRAFSRGAGPLNTYAIIACLVCDTAPDPEIVKYVKGRHLAWRQALKYPLHGLDYFYKR